VAFFEVDEEVFGWAKVLFLFSPILASTSIDRN
jgi:hypothetical protein